jgi:DNA-binding XRE family transcriptional regulator
MPTLYLRKLAFYDTFTLNRGGRIMFETGQDIRDFREHYSYSQKELADKIGYEKTSICKIEKRNVNISKRLRQRLILLAEKAEAEEKATGISGEIGREELNGIRIAELLTGFGCSADDIDSFIGVLSILLKRDDKVASGRGFIIFLMDYLTDAVIIKDIKSQLDNEEEQEVCMKRLGLIQSDLERIVKQYIGFQKEEK